MSNTDLVPQELAPVVTPDELRLVRTVIAPNATDAELQLFLYDCKRQGVHPLDKLLHFTKRGDKYTPITSIDLMRTRAHDTGECAGIDDAVFDGTVAERGFVASVLVYRMVQGQRCAFAGSARWEEYCPPSGQDRMWRKMPHTMLGKCAEALALRKAFPRQLAGLYAREEMDQAGPETFTPTPTRARIAPPPADTETGEVIEGEVMPAAPVCTCRAPEGKPHGQQCPARAANGNGHAAPPEPEQGSDTGKPRKEGRDGLMAALHARLADLKVDTNDRAFVRWIASRYLVNRPVGSMKELTDPELRRYVDALSHVTEAETRHYRDVYEADIAASTAQATE